MAVDSALPPWLRRLRQAQVVRRVMADPRSHGETLLGHCPHDVRSHAAGWGQADFDQSWRDLSPDDRVLLYAYFFQLRHLEELTYAFRSILSDWTPRDRVVVVDLGCGPCTGGLAFAAALGADASFEYIGIDRSAAMRSLGARLAAAATKGAAMANVSCRWAADLNSVDWKEPARWRTVVVVASFLFASRSLDPVQLSNDLNTFLSRVGRGEVAVLYTNSIHSQFNQGFPAFASKLKDFGFRVIKEGAGEVRSRRNHKSVEHRLRFALLHRRRQNILTRRDNK